MDIKKRNGVPQIKIFGGPNPLSAPDEEVTQIQIVGGPTHSALCDALEYAYNTENPHTVTFSVVRPPYGNGIRYHVQAKVVGLLYESGAPGMFMVTLLPLDCPFLNKGLTTGFYNVRAQRGYLNVVR